MSDHTNKNLLFETKANYLQRHVGGKQKPPNNIQYIGDQLDLIQAGDKFLPPNVRQNGFEVNQLPNNSHSKINSFNQNVPYSKSIQNGHSSINKNMDMMNGKMDIYMRNEQGRYDPYKGFLYDEGLMDDGTNRRRYKTTYLNIDSNFRIKEPSSDIDDSFILDKNPLDFNINSNRVFIKHENHPYVLGDLIQLESAISDQSILRTFDDDGNPTFQIPGGCNFMRINHPHGLPLNYIGDSVEIELKEIKGDRGSVETSSYLGNIPINIINGTHKVILELTQADLDPNCDLSNFPDDFLEAGKNHFFILLPISMRNPDNEPPFVLREYNFKIIKKSIAGIPLNFINARYPIDPDHRQGFHVIKNVFDNGYEIDLKINAISDTTGGGSCVTVSKIVKIETGYPNANKYIIDLETTFHDIISAKIVSMEFPNSDTAIREFPQEKANNKLYWNDIDDGDFLYSISVPEGNYTPTELVTLLENLFVDTPRINSGTNIGSNYQSTHFVQVRIDPATSEVSFESFKQWCLILPIIDVQPDIVLDPELADPFSEANSQYTLTIRHPGHGMVNPGETILIRGAIPYKGIPASALNTIHTVSEIIDQNTYKIVLPQCQFNLLATRQDSNGGAAVTILIPDLFRMRFDQPDTLGNVLGFRNPGNANSVYDFAKKISNKDPYAFDMEENVLGETIIIENNAIQLSGDNYVLMVANPLVTVDSTGPIKRAFAKILLCDIPGKVLFNTHVNTARFYKDPLHELSQLEVEFYTPDGVLYDFNGLEHSYTIEIVTVNDIPEDTGINANTGKNYNIVV